MRSAIALSLTLFVSAGCASTPAPPVYPGGNGAGSPVCPAAPAAPKGESASTKMGDTPPSKPAPVDGVRVDGIKDEVVRRLNGRDAEGLFELFGPEMKAAVPVPAAKSFIVGLLAEHGAIVSVTRDPHTGDARHGIYLLAMERKPARMDLQLDEGGQIIGLNIADPPPPEPVVARSDLPMALPFHGAWTVFSGGDRVEVNPHIGNKSQRRAADLVVVGENGKTFRTDGKTNGDYLAYGREVSVVAAGTVSEIVDGVHENVPGAMNPYVAPGNFVIVKHGPAL